jgi:hypothetical protein
LSIAHLLALGGLAINHLTIIVFYNNTTTITILKALVVARKLGFVPWCDPLDACDWAPADGTRRHLRRRLDALPINQVFCNHLIHAGNADTSMIAWDKFTCHVCVETDGTFMCIIILELIIAVVVGVIAGDND